MLCNMRKKILFVLLCAALLVGSIFGLHASPAHAIINIDSATRIGNGEDLWEGNGVNDEVANELYDKLFGGQDEVEYIKQNGAYDYETYGKDSPNEEMRDIPYYVVPATTINANIGNDRYGLSLTLGGVDWMVTSLTLADIGGKKNQVIATLFYFSSEVYVNSTTYAPSLNVQGNNMYSSSQLRKTLLEREDLAMFSKGSFAENYLVQPKYITYQHTETMVRRYGLTGTNCPNDALGAMPSGWGNTEYPEPSFEYQGAFDTPVRYDAWGEDYIWIPSITETGSKEVRNSIWQLTIDQLITGQVAHWLRSGSNGYDYRYAMQLAPNDVRKMDRTSNNKGVLRYAVHLNLSAIPRCEHEYGEWQTTTPATHTTAGERTSTCGKCGKTRTEEIPASTDAHTWDGGVITSAPTCSVAGSVTYTCLEDSSHTKTEVVPVDPDAHNAVTDPRRAAKLYGGRQNRGQSLLAV